MASFRLQMPVERLRIGIRSETEAATLTNGGGILRKPIPRNPSRFA
jgi:hypothetical protein